MRVPALLLAVSVITGCSSPTSLRPLENVSFDFGIHRLAVEPAFVVNGTRHEILLRGYYEALTSGCTANAAAYLAGHTIVIRITGRQPGASHPVIVATGYQVIIRGLEAGSFRVQVIHDWAGVNRPPELVHESDVQVM